MLPVVAARDAVGRDSPDPRTLILNARTKVRTF
ncbi:hypothetical protein GA0070610_5389 [Micromonospora echinofusca]|uniref:Uncharacterized protein n=1 Tax=Micromonospora echinofusca TaxID=47858 RepID=A0A1C5GGS4_MICEH|nr:hypothetical protein GA0070610_5389 [Micromonospora echinofusca]